MRQARSRSRLMTRYEAWPVAGALLAATVVARWREGAGRPAGLVDAARLASLPAVALLWFVVHSKATVGAWFVTGGFYVPDPIYQHHAVAVTGAVWWGLRALGSEVLARAAALAVALLVYWWWRRRPAGQRRGRPGLARRRGAAVVRLLPGPSVPDPLHGAAGGRQRRAGGPGGRPAPPLAQRPWRPCCSAASGGPRGRSTPRPPWCSKRSGIGPRAWRAARSPAACPRPGGDEIVMASMGSLAHYMQELSHDGFALRDFLHEGNGDLWLAALAHPRDHVRWILMEEVAEGGDMLAERARREPAFLAGFTRVCEGGGVALTGPRRALRLACLRTASQAGWSGTQQCVRISTSGSPGTSARPGRGGRRGTRPPAARRRPSGSALPRPASCWRRPARAGRRRSPARPRCRPP